MSTLCDAVQCLVRFTGQCSSRSADISIVFFKHSTSVSSLLLTLQHRLEDGIFCVFMDVTLYLFSVPVSHYIDYPFTEMFCLVPMSEFLNTVNTVVTVVVVSASASYRSIFYRCCSSIGNTLGTLSNAAFVRK